MWGKIRAHAGGYFMPPLRGSSWENKAILYLTQNPALREGRANSLMEGAIAPCARAFPTLLQQKRKANRSAVGSFPDKQLRKQRMCLSADPALPIDSLVCELALLDKNRAIHRPVTAGPPSRVSHAVESPKRDSYVPQSSSQ